MSGTSSRAGCSARPLFRRLTAWRSTLRVLNSCWIRWDRQLSAPGLKIRSISCIPIPPFATLTSPCWQPACAPWICWRWPRVSPRRTRNCSPWKCGVGRLSTLQCAFCGNARGAGCSNYAKRYPIFCFRCCSGAPMRWVTKLTRII